MKPCPFCGCDRVNVFSHYHCGPSGMVEERKVQCVMCLAEAPEDIWDRRAVNGGAPRDVNFGLPVNPARVDL